MTTALETNNLFDFFMLMFMRLSLYWKRANPSRWWEREDKHIMQREGEIKHAIS